MPQERELLIMLSKGGPNIERSSLINFAGRGSNKQVVDLDESISLESASREIVSKCESAQVSSNALRSGLGGWLPLLESARELLISSLITIIFWLKKLRKSLAVNEFVIGEGLRVRFATVSNKNF